MLRLSIETEAEARDGAAEAARQFGADHEAGVGDVLPLSVDVLAVVVAVVVFVVFAVAFCCCCCRCQFCRCCCCCCRCCLWSSSSSSCVAP